MEIDLTTLKTDLEEDVVLMGTGVEKAILDLQDSFGETCTLEDLQSYSGEYEEFAESLQNHIIKKM